MGTPFLLALVIAALEIAAYAAMWTPYLSLIARFSLLLDDVEGLDAPLEHAASGESASTVWRADGAAVWLRHRFIPGSRNNNTFVVRLRTSDPRDASWGVPLLGAVTAFGLSYAAYIAVRVVAPERFAHEVLGADQILAHVGLLVTITVSLTALLTLLGRHIARDGLEEWLALHAKQ